MEEHVLMGSDRGQHVLDWILLDSYQVLLASTLDDQTRQKYLAFYSLHPQSLLCPSTLFLSFPFASHLLPISQTNVVDSVACSLKNQVQIYDLFRLFEGTLNVMASMQVTGKYQQPETISLLRSHHGLLWTGTVDGLIRAWDTRQPLSPVLMLPHHLRSVTTLESIHSFMLASGR